MFSFFVFQTYIIRHFNTQFVYLVFPWLFLVHWDSHRIHTVTTIIVFIGIVVLVVFAKIIVTVKTVITNWLRLRSIITIRGAHYWSLAVSRTTTTAAFCGGFCAGYKTFISLFIYNNLVFIMKDRNSNEKTLEKIWRTNVSNFYLRQSMNL